MSDDIKLDEVLALRAETLAKLHDVRSQFVTALEPHASVLAACEAFIVANLDKLGAEQVLARKFVLEDDIAALSAPGEEVVKALAASQKACESFVHAHLTSKNLQNMKLSSGPIAFLQKGSSCSVYDWDTVLDDVLRAATCPDNVSPELWIQYLTYIKAMGNFQILVQNVSKKAVKEIVDAKGAPPDGVKYETYQTVQFRRGKETA